MAQRNISCRLSRSLNVYLRCRCFRCGSLNIPTTIRNYHGRDSGFEPDDSFKKLKQDNSNKVKDSSAPTALRIHRSGKAKVSPPMDKSESPERLSNVTIEIKSGQIQSDSLVESPVSSDKTISPTTCATGTPPIDGSKQFDMSRFEKTSEENKQIIEGLLKGLEPKGEDRDLKVSAKDEKFLSHIQALKIPSHEEVHRARVEQESIIKNMNPYVSYKKSNSSSNTPSPPKPDAGEMHFQHNKTPNTQDSMSLFKSRNSELKKDEPKNSNSNRETVNIKISEATNLDSKSAVKYNSAISEMKVRIKNSNTTQNETTKQSEPKPAITLTGKPVEPYVFPTMEKLDSRYKSLNNTIADLAQKEKAKQSSGQKKDKLNIQIRDASKVETTKRKFSSRNTDNSDNNKDQDKDLEMDSKLNEEAELSESSSDVAGRVIENATNKGPLKGTVALLLNSNTRTRMGQEPGDFPDEGHTSGEIRITPLTLSYGDSDKFNNQNRTIIGKSKAGNMKFRNNDKLVRDAKAAMKANRLSRKRSKSANDDIARLEEEFEKTIGTQIIADLAKKKPVSKMSLKTTKSSKPTTSSVSKNTIKSSSELTPGELYHSNSECHTYENWLDDNATKLERHKFQSGSRHKKSIKFGKRPKSKSDDKSNIQLETDFKPRKNRKSESEMLTAGTSESKNKRHRKKMENSDFQSQEMGFFDSAKKGMRKIDLELKDSESGMQIKGETNLTPGELYNSQSETGDRYEPREFPSKPKKISRKGMNFKRKKITDKFESKNKKSADRVETREAKQEEAKDQTESAVSDYIKPKSHVKKRAAIKFQNKQERNFESGKTEKTVESKSEAKLPKVSRTSKTPEAKARDDSVEENLKHAKLYISKAKRLHDLAKKKSLDRKNRMRSASKKSKKKKSKKGSEKMSLSDFLYGLVVNKDNKDGGNQRNFTTYTAARCSISFSDDWPLKRRSANRYNFVSSGSSHPKKGDVFISPEVKRQGLGADNIKRERKKNEKKRKRQSEKNESTNKFSSIIETTITNNNPITREVDNIVQFHEAENHTKIRGGSLMEQKHNRRLNRIKIMDEEFDIRVMGQTQEIKKQRSNHKLNKDTNKRSFNTISQNILESLRFQQNSLESKIDELKDEDFLQLD